MYNLTKLIKRVNRLESLVDKTPQSHYKGIANYTVIGGVVEYRITVVNDQCKIIQLLEGKNMAQEDFLRLVSELKLSSLRMIKDDITRSTD